MRHAQTEEEWQEKMGEKVLEQTSISPDEEGVSALICVTSCAASFVRCALLAKQYAPISVIRYAPTHSGTVNSGDFPYARKRAAVVSPFFSARNPFSNRYRSSIIPTTFLLCLFPENQPVLNLKTYQKQTGVHQNFHQSCLPVQKPGKKIHQSGRAEHLHDD